MKQHIRIGIIICYTITTWLLHTQNVAYGMSDRRIPRLHHNRILPPITSLGLPRPHGTTNTRRPTCDTPYDNSMAQPGPQTTPSALPHNRCDANTEYTQYEIERVHNKLQRATHTPATHSPFFSSYEVSLLAQNKRHLRDTEIHYLLHRCINSSRYTILYFKKHEPDLYNIVEEASRRNILHTCRSRWGNNVFHKSMSRTFATRMGPQRAQFITSLVNAFGTPTTLSQKETHLGQTPADACLFFPETEHVADVVTAILQRGGTIEADMQPPKHNTLMHIRAKNLRELSKRYQGHALQHHIDTAWHKTIAYARLQQLATSDIGYDGCHVAILPNQPAFHTGSKKRKRSSSDAVYYLYNV